MSHIQLHTCNAMQSDPAELAGQGKFQSISSRESIMQAAQRIIAVTLFATLSAAAVAQDNPELSAPEPVSTKSRAQVQAELQQARSDGTFDRLFRPDLIRPEPTSGMKTRAQVRAELEEAYASGEYATVHSEGQSSFPFMPRPATYAQRGR